MFRLSVVQRVGAVVVAIVLGTTTGWTIVQEQEAKLIASDAAADDQFGSSVAVGGDTAVVRGGDSAYVFVAAPQRPLTLSDKRVSTVLKCRLLRPKGRCQSCSGVAASRTGPSTP